MQLRSVCLINHAITQESHIKIQLASPDGSQRDESGYGRCLLEHLTALANLDSQDLNSQGLCKHALLHRTSSDLVTLTPAKVSDTRSLPIAHSITCPAMMHPEDTDGSKKLRYAAAIVIENPDAAILITKRTSSMKSFPDTWVIPGGHIELRETWKEAVQRETQEEVGLNDLHDLKTLGLWESVYPPIWNQEPPLRQHLVIYCSAKTSSHVIHPSEEEIAEYVWLAPLQAIALVNHQDSTKLAEVISVKESTCQRVPLSQIRGSLKQRSGTTQGTRFALSRHFQI